jgi:fructan beta-fructosidase
MKPALTLLAAALLVPSTELQAADALGARAVNRPAFHFAPPQGWMNDPNGLLYHDGEYHLFYQAYPADTKRVIYPGPAGAAGAHISWGHAVSRDLIGWEHLPLAIPEEVGKNRLGAIYSGSAVVDYANRSGLGSENQPAVVAFYTVMQFGPAAADGSWQPTTQPVAIAYSTDRGRTFTKNDRNPVVDVGDRKFGDPKVFWHEPSQQWIMVNIWGYTQGKVGFWGSSNLKDWKFLSEFRAEQEAPGKWECPDLFPLAVDGDAGRTKWVLKVNCRNKKYFIGEFDGREFRADPALDSSLPYSQGSFYAEVTFNGIPQTDGRRLMMGWINQGTSEKRAWTGLQSVTRELTLKTTPEGLRVCQEPVRELRKLRGTGRKWEDVNITPGEAPSTLGLVGSLWELQADFSPGSAAEFGFRFSLDDGREVKIGYDQAEQQIFFDQPGQNRRNTPQPLRGSTLTLQVLVDHSVIEVFAEGGETNHVLVINPDASVTGVSLFAKGGLAAVKRLEAWPLGK